MLKIGIIGAGAGGASILETFLDIDDVDVIGICDNNSNAPGIKRARENGVPVYDDFNDLLQLNKEKVILEVTGNDIISEKVKEAADEKTKIIDSETSLILFKIVNSREEMLKRMEVEADKLCNLAVDIGGTIEEISDSNSENIEELDQTASKLQQASENSKANLEKTNEIVKFIKTVSDQTKMLGLNAAIEAARADVKANGFNVVADEIRKLADETGASVKEITGFIEKLNESTENTKINIDKMNQKVDQFTENEKIMTEKLHNAADQITKMAESLSELID
ncbi:MULTISPECIES: methyl-accepting chemotaxis protein [Halanaerobium]|jgi:methyl-accepting chemotaxis protein|uniref:Methyl-accepting chemotaxis protein n=1 Tax=Halanaerobium kushneri TaxID=56779 RepID=A0A1N6TQZ1_9FIRM|nr:MULTISPECIES: methyl-accepting chemotaxis protein [Halanaerobium]RCW53319.1 methyl-accepting chemotaxis protein [Halanaerobium sp. ST460_2HS_T2]SIQ55802.1 methyl-accepting chemotaxis protein [Halanaerobium kushneri]